MYYYFATEKLFFTCLKQIFYCLLQSPPIWFHLNMSIYNWHWTSYWPDCESLQPFHTGWDQTFWSNSPRNQSLRIPYIRNQIKSIYHNTFKLDIIMYLKLQSILIFILPSDWHSAFFFDHIDWLYDDILQIRTYELGIYS